MTSEAKAKSRQPPIAREPNDPPLVWRVLAPEGYFTPSYGLGWRLTYTELFNSIDPGDNPIDVDDVADFLIPRRWEEFGYLEKYGPDLSPRMVIIPYSPRYHKDNELILFVLTNGKKEWIEQSQRAESAEIIEAVRHTLGLSDELHAGLKWHAFHSIKRADS